MVMDTSSKAIKGGGSSKSQLGLEFAEMQIPPAACVGFLGVGSKVACFPSCGS
jgi:hypothetical protein